MEPGGFVRVDKEKAQEIVGCRAGTQRAAPLLFTRRFKKFGGFDAACGELGDELAIRGEEIVLTKFARQDPGDLFEGDRFDGVVFDGRSEKSDFERFVAIGVFVLDAAEFDGFGQLGVKFFAQFTGEGGFGSFPFLHFSTWEFPFERRRVAFAALADEDAAVGAFDHGGDDGFHELTCIRTRHFARILAS